MFVLEVLANVIGFATSFDNVIVFVVLKLKKNGPRMEERSKYSKKRTLFDSSPTLRSRTTPGPSHIQWRETALRCNGAWDLPRAPLSAPLFCFALNPSWAYVCVRAFPTIIARKPQKCLLNNDAHMLPFTADLSKWNRKWK